ncbi:MAG: NAD(P)H-dependent oxidoreductase [Spirochaetales bacterium]|nr:NAD(P)H-dependent oxidoreductase [Spirochaetales bacterium]
MKILILYYSRTGHTEGLAEEVLRGVERVPGIEGVLKSASKVTKEDFLSADGIIAGSPVYFGTMAAELKKVLDDYVGIRGKMENKIGAAFATSGAPTGGKETTIMSILQAFLIYGMIIVGDPLSATGHYGTAFYGEIDEETRENAAKLGARVALLAKATGEVRKRGQE